MARFPIEVPEGRYFDRLIACREGCPVHTDSRGYVQAAAAGDWAQSYRIARGPNPFASICGRVCGAPCEKACRRGAIDEPVSIRALKRAATERHGPEAVGDLAATLALSTAPGSLHPAPRTEKVAVVGAGVAGLTAAHDLARLGYKVTVFEESGAPGGMLRTGVPLFRLPRQVVQREIDAILALGVELRCGVRVGSQVTLPELRAQGYAAVLIAVGLQKARMLELPGAKLAGVVGGLDYLRDFNDKKSIAPMGRVLVIGGGNVAYDCARSAVRTAGTTGVTLACLEALHEMPADQVEIDEGDEEGIARRNRVGPVRFVEGPDGKLAGVEVRKVSRVFDENRRFAPELVAGTEEIIPCDTVLVAVGQAGDTTFVAGLPEAQLGRAGTIIADKQTGKTSIPWLFGAGDAAMGPGLFIDAIAQASRAVRSIDAFLQKRPVAEAEAVRGFAVEGSRQGMWSNWLELDRKAPPVAPVQSRVKSLEEQVELSYPEEEARRQGARCLRCEVETVFDGSLCIQCGGCSDVCPTWCLRLVSLDEIGMPQPAGQQLSAIIKDEERCIRCAACADRCPTDAITMERLCGFEPWAPIVTGEAA
ncbi:MAG: FAD-dependent oxidoreductase [Deltaproteobacteria bacterium]|nr:FAD-dependent oxidoreductase [Deltaproteobacteria bacterium]